IFLKNLFYINNGFLITQYWSLVYEIIFYLLIPIFIIKPRFYLFVSAILFMIHFYIFGTQYTQDNFVLLNYFLHYNIYFAIGVALYLYKDKLLKPIFLNKALNIIIGFALYFACIGVKLLSEKSSVLPEIVSVILCIHLMQTFLYYD